MTIHIDYDREENKTGFLMVSQTKMIITLIEKYVLRKKVIISNQYLGFDIQTRTFGATFFVDCNFSIERMRHGNDVEMLRTLACLEALRYLS